MCPQINSTVFVSPCKKMYRFVEFKNQQIHFLSSNYVMLENCQKLFNANGAKFVGYSVFPRKQLLFSAKRFYIEIFYRFYKFKTMSFDRKTKSKI